MPEQYHEAVTLNALLATNEEEKINWILLTTIPLNSFEDCQYVVKLYKKRWLIERYHYILKSGCLIEELQLKTGDGLKKALILYSIAACQILRLTLLPRLQAQTPCTIMFCELEWQLIYRLGTKSLTLPNSPPTLKQITYLLGKIGGFLGRKGDGDPGVKVLWRGLMDVRNIVMNYPLLVGKG